jgi:hypothetical protein
MKGWNRFRGLVSLPLLLVWVLTAQSSAALGTTRGGEEERKKPEFAGAYIMLPELTDQQRFRNAIEANRDREKYLARAQKTIGSFSLKLEEYIRLWLQGKAKAEFPEGFLPPYIDNAKTHSWRLVRPEEVDPQDQWYAICPYDPAERLHQHSPDPHATYLKMIFLAPLGSRLLVEGDFGHARFMDYQILTPVDPEHPVTGQMGICEVPIVDVDIEPDAGHVNPFRKGADRNAEKRHYHLTFDLKAGNALDLNPRAMKSPQYRARGNTRVGGPFAFTGPYGGDVLVPSVLWLRYFAPDKGAGCFAGVDLPRATLQLRTGEKFWITCDKSLAVKVQTQEVPRISTPPIEPYPFLGPSLGWFKMFGIMYLHAEARAYYQSRPWGEKDPAEARKRIRQMFRLIFNQGPGAPPPGNYGNAATECNYTSYLSRPISLGADKVIVLTGKLPVFPETRNGAATMEGGQVRYFSITHQLGRGPHNKKYSGMPYGSLMDDEIVINDNREYVIVFSREKERPPNAKPEYGVTWQEWGAPALQTLVLRWMSVMPEWYLPKYSPHEDNAPWERAGWASDDFDKSLFGRNRPGLMGPYQPVIHYMSRQQFASIGKKPIRPAHVPEWKDKTANATGGKGSSDVQEKVQDFRQALQAWRNVRQGGDRKAIRSAATELRRTWDALPDSVQEEIEERNPGITRKIEGKTP